MNEQAQEVLAQMMQKALDGVDAAVEFGKAEIPVVVEQLLMWHMVESLISALFSLVVLVGMILYWCKATPFLNKEVQKDYMQQRDGLLMMTTIGGGVMTLIGLFTFLIAFDLAWLKILVAPKLYLLEYGASLVK